MIVVSNAVEHNSVTFPAFLAERHYMREFKKKEGLPQDLSRWQPTIDQMLDGVEAEGSIFVMIDQSVVTTGNTHRRSGLHVDLVWGECVNTGTMKWKDEESRWKKPTPGIQDQTLILASDVTASCYYAGQWDNRMLGDGGDCTKVNKDNLLRIAIKPGVAYVGSAFHTLHESLPVEVTCCRTLVRLHVNPH